MAAPLTVPAGPAPDGVGAFLHQRNVHTAVTLPSLAHMGTHPVYQPPAAAAAAGTFTGGALGTTGWWNAHGQGRYPANWAALTPMARHTWIDAMEPSPVPRSEMADTLVTFLCSRSAQRTGSRGSTRRPLLKATTGCSRWGPSISPCKSDLKRRGSGILGIIDWIMACTFQ
eukprot:COSAG06_NODE_4177_length_4481_cov_13.193636_1_plen_171_part_00